MGLILHRTIIFASMLCSTVAQSENETSDPLYDNDVSDNGTVADGVTGVLNATGMIRAFNQTLKAFEGMGFLPQLKDSDRPLAFLTNYALSMIADFCTGLGAVSSSAALAHTFWMPDLSYAEQLEKIAEFSEIFDAQNRLHEQILNVDSFFRSIIEKTTLATLQGTKNRDRKENVKVSFSNLKNVGLETKPRSLDEFLTNNDWVFETKQRKWQSGKAKDTLLSIKEILTNQQTYQSLHSWCSTNDPFQTTMNFVVEALQPAHDNDNLIWIFALLPKSNLSTSLELATGVSMVAMRSMYITAQCFGILRRDVNEASAMLSSLGSMTADLITEMFHALYEAFEKFKVVVGCKRFGDAADPKKIIDENREEYPMFLTEDPDNPDGAYELKIPGEEKDRLYFQKNTSFDRSKHFFKECVVTYDSLLSQLAVIGKDPKLISEWQQKYPMVENDEINSYEIPGDITTVYMIIRLDKDTVLPIKHVENTEVSGGKIDAEVDGKDTELWTSQLEGKMLSIRTLTAQERSILLHTGAVKIREYAFIKDFTFDITHENPSYKSMVFTDSMEVDVALSQSRAQYTDQQTLMTNFCRNARPDRYTLKPIYSLEEDGNLLSAVKGIFSVHLAKNFHSTEICGPSEKIVISFVLNIAKVVLDDKVDPILFTGYGNSFNDAVNKSYNALFSAAHEETFRLRRLKNQKEEVVEEDNRATFIGGAIGGVLGLILIVALIVGVIVFVRRRKASEYVDEDMRKDKEVPAVGKTKKSKSKKLMQKEEAPETAVVKTKKGKTSKGKLPVMSKEKIGKAGSSPSMGTVGTGKAVSKRSVPSLQTVGTVDTIDVKRTPSRETKTPRGEKTESKTAKKATSAETPVSKDEGKKKRGGLFARSPSLPAAESPVVKEEKGKGKGKKGKRTKSKKTKTAETLPAPKKVGEPKQKKPLPGTGGKRGSRKSLNTIQSLPKQSPASVKGGVPRKGKAGTSPKVKSRPSIDSKKPRLSIGSTKAAIRPKARGSVDSTAGKGARPSIVSLTGKNTPTKTK